MSGLWGLTFQYRTSKFVETPCKMRKRFTSQGDGNSQLIKQQTNKRKNLVQCLVRVAVQ